MLTFPISIDTFKKSFLGGVGDVRIETDRDVWGSLFENYGRFTQADDRVDDIVDFKVALTGESPLTLGRNNGFAMDVDASAEHTIQLLWPNGDHAILKSSGLEFNHDQLAYLRLVLTALGNASVSGEFAAPPGLTTKIGFGAGAGVRYEFLKRIDTRQSIKEILPPFLADVVFPQQIDHPDLIPDDGNAESDAPASHGATIVRRDILPQIHGRTNSDCIAE